MKKTHPYPGRTAKRVRFSTAALAKEIPSSSIVLAHCWFLLHIFEVCNPLSNASFSSITGFRFWHSPFGVNERLGSCEIIHPLVELNWEDIILEGERDLPPHQLFTFAVGSSFLMFEFCNPFSQASFINITGFRFWILAFPLRCQ